MRPVWRSAVINNSHYLEVAPTLLFTLDDWKLISFIHSFVRSIQLFSLYNRANKSSIRMLKFTSHYLFKWWMLQKFRIEIVNECTLREIILKAIALIFYSMHNEYIAAELISYGIYHWCSNLRVVVVIVASIKHDRMIVLRAAIRSSKGMSSEFHTWSSQNYHQRVIKVMNIHVIILCLSWSAHRPLNSIQMNSHGQNIDFKIS